MQADTIDPSLSNFTPMDPLNTTDSSPCTLRLSSLASLTSVRSDRLPSCSLWRRRCSLAVYSPFLSLYTHLSFALSRFISIELHGMESFVAQKFQHVCKFEMHVYLHFRSFNLKFRYMAANRHTHTSCNVVTLVWGSLRLTPIMKIISSHKHTSQKIYHRGGEPERAMHC